MKLIYVAGPFTADTPEEIQSNIDKAVLASAYLNAAGDGRYFCVCPHSMTAPIWKEMAKRKLIEPEANNVFWYEGSIKMLGRCGYMVLLPGYENSKGCKKEAEECHFNYIPVFLMEEITLEWAKRVIKLCDLNHEYLS